MVEYMVRDRKQYNAEWRLKNKELLRTYRHKYWKDNKVKLNAKHRIYAAKYRSTLKYITWRQNYVAKNNKKIFGREKDLRTKAKLEVLSHYSLNMCCIQCGFTDVRALSIDHINGGGNTHRKSIKRGNMYYWIRKNKFPSGFQVLCMNCQFIKRHEKYEGERLC
jgi:hypothetical protein